MQTSTLPNDKNAAGDIRMPMMTIRRCGQGTALQPPRYCNLQTPKASGLAVVLCSAFHRRSLKRINHLKTSTCPEEAIPNEWFHHGSITDPKSSNSKVRRDSCCSYCSLALGQTQTQMLLDDRCCEVVSGTSATSRQILTEERHFIRSSERSTPAIHGG